MSSQTSQDGSTTDTKPAGDEQHAPKPQLSLVAQVVFSALSVVAATVIGPVGVVAAVAAVALGAVIGTLSDEAKLIDSLRKALRRPLKFAAAAWQPLIVAASFVLAARVVPDQVTAGKLANEFHQQAAQVLPVLLIGLALEAGYFRVRGRTLFQAGGALVPAALLVVGEVVALAELAQDQDGGVGIIAGAMIAGTVALVVAALNRDTVQGDTQTVAITVEQGGHLDLRGSVIRKS